MNDRQPVDGGLAVFQLLVVAATPTPPVACLVDGLVVAVKRGTRSAACSA